MRRRKSMPLLRIPAAILEGILWTAAGMALCAAVLPVLGLMPASVMHVTAHVLWCIGSFMAGRRAGYACRRHGICTGLACGAGMCLVLLCGMCLSGGAFSPRIGVRCLLLLGSGAIGGVTGVNTPHKVTPGLRFPIRLHRHGRKRQGKDPVKRK